MTTAAELAAKITLADADLDRLNGAVNDPPGTFTTDEGTLVRNLRGRLEDVGYLPPVAFAAGLEPQDASFTVTYDGKTYHADPNDTPFTTTATFDPSQWVLLVGPRDFANRPAAVTWVAGGGTASPGHVMSDGTVMYVATPGATTISDILGFVPFGTWTPFHFNATGDGVTDDKTALDAANVSGETVDLLNKTYEYSGTFTPAALFINGSVIDDNITQTFDVQRKGQVTGSDLSTQGYLNHDDGRGGNTAAAWKNTLATVRGTASSPDSETRYAHTASFTELHSDVALTTAQSSWGNSYKIGAVVGEGIAEAGFSGEMNGGVFRAYSTEEATGPDEFRRTLVGVSAIGQSNTGAGNTSYDVWGANFVAAHTSGNVATNVVGCEVDVLNSVTSAGLLPGDVGATNFSGFWAQSDASAGCQSDTAFLATNTATGDGWRQILQAKGTINSWAVYLETTVNSQDARGIYAKTLWQADTGRLLELWAGGNEQMRVDGDANDAVSVRVGGALEKLEVGAADSGGVGYRMVRVTN